MHTKFFRFGLGCEVFSAQLPLVAFDVPADADFREIKQVLAAYGLVPPLPRSRRPSSYAVSIAWCGAGA